MGHFVNDVDACVTEALEGVALNSFGNLVLVRGRNVILVNPQRTLKRCRVAIVCGGGSGHEPAHSHFVSHEMLSAAICGDVFASPGVGAIVDGIRTLFSNCGTLHGTSGQRGEQKGVLVIIKNYTGDRINFGMACEILSSEGFLLKKLIVADDVSLPKAAERRGVAGTILVYKIAGALALQQERHKSSIQEQLNEVFEMAKKVNDNIHSMGCALSSCQRPDGSTLFTLPEGEMEIGVGIHGERGVSRRAISSGDEIVSVLIDAILAAKQQDEFENSGKTVSRSFKKMVLLTNNLGSVSGLEMGVVHRKAILYLRERGYEVCRAYCGTYMTSLDMRGISFTLLTVVDDRFLDLLDVGESNFVRMNWKPDSNYSPSSSPLYIDAPRTLDSDFESFMSNSADAVDEEFLVVMNKVCKAGVEARETLNSLDAECGDGDAGDTLATACSALLSNIRFFSVYNVNVAFRRIAKRLTDAVGGTSGPLYAVFFIRAATAFSSHTERSDLREWKSTTKWKEALHRGIGGIEELGGCVKGDKTMLDVLYPVYDALESESAKGGMGLEHIVDTAKDAAEQTRNLEAKGGRARYVQGRGVGKLDPGVFAVYLLLKSLLKEKN